MARDRLHHVDGRRRRDELGQLLLQAQRVQPVGRDPGDRHLGGDARQRGRDAAAPAADVVVVHRLATARCRCWRRSGATSFSPWYSRYDSTVYRPPSNGCSSPWWPRPNRCVELELGAVADLPDAAGDRRARARAVAGLGVVVVAAAEVRVGSDRADLQRAQRDLLGGRRRAARDDHRARRRGRDTSTAHSSTRMPPIEPPTTAAHRSMPSASASAASTATWSRIVIVGKREPYGVPVAGSIDDGPGRALAPAEHVRAHDEEPVGVDRRARAR